MRLNKHPYTTPSHLKPVSQASLQKRGGRSGRDQLEPIIFTKSNGCTFFQTLHIAAGQRDPDLVDLRLFLQTFLLVRLKGIEKLHTRTSTTVETLGQSMPLRVNQHFLKQLFTF